MISCQLYLKGGSVEAAGGPNDLSICVTDLNQCQIYEDLCLQLIAKSSKSWDLPCENWGIIVRILLICLTIYGQTIIIIKMVLFYLFIQRTN